MLPSTIYNFLILIVKPEKACLGPISGRGGAIDTHQKTDVYGLGSRPIARDVTSACAHEACEMRIASQLAPSWIKFGAASTKLRHILRHVNVCLKCTAQTWCAHAL